MSKSKKYIVSKTSSINTAKSTHTRGEILNQEQYDLLPDVFKAKVEEFNPKDKNHLRLSQAHESPELQDEISFSTGNVGYPELVARVEAIEKKLGINQEEKETKSDDSAKDDKSGKSDTKDSKSDDSGKDDKSDSKDTKSSSKKSK